MTHLLTSEYYLHTNGSVIHKPHGGVDRNSDFVRKVWTALQIGKTPQCYCNWLVELIELGVSVKRVTELAKAQDLDRYVPNWQAIVFNYTS